MGWGNSIYWCKNFSFRSWSSQDNDAAQTHKDTPSLSAGSSCILDKQVQGESPENLQFIAPMNGGKRFTGGKWCERPNNDAVLPEQVAIVVNLLFIYVLCWFCAKTIYVARNAKDNLVSYFFFDMMNMTQPEPGPWDGYIQKFIQGERKSWFFFSKYLQRSASTLSSSLPSFFCQHLTFHFGGCFTNSDHNTGTTYT